MANPNPIDDRIVTTNRTFSSKEILERISESSSLPTPGDEGDILTVVSGEWASAASSGGSYTDEQAQDAVGAMIDSSLVYTDATPLLQRAALTGDVTASAGSNATTIANDAVTTAKIINDAVTYAKIQNVSNASRLLGRGSNSGSGDAQEITIGTGLSMSNTTLSSANISDAMSGSLTKTNSATYSDILASSRKIGFAVTTSSRWSYHIIIQAQTGAGGIKFKFTYPDSGGTTGIISAYTLDPSGGFSSVCNALQINSEVSFPNAATGLVVHIYGYIIPDGAGTVQLQYAQNTSNAAGSTVSAGSIIFASRIA